MENKELSKNIANATKWSSVTEILAKIIVPVTNMILARLLTPEAFGVIATITIVISFADMLTDSGFQKYLIQQEFESESIKIQCINVAFWTNLIISFLLWFIIVVFNDQIATLIGSPGLGLVIVVAGLSLPLTSFSSIQMAIYRRDLDYRTLFYARIIGVCIPFVVTIPLAILGYSYWSLIAGTICGNFINAAVLTIKSQWKPKVYYNFSILKKMLSFSIWSLAEAIPIWASPYIGTIIVASGLNNYYLGLYNTTIVTVNGIFAIITTATTSVLFSSLSRLQNNDDEFKKVFFQFLRLIAMVILPMGIGIYIYRDLLTDILLGKQWQEASLFVGIWGFMSSITIIFGQYCSEVYRSKGRPKLSLLVQILYLIVLVPTLLISARYGFDILIYSVSFIKVIQILVNWIVMHSVFKISPLLMIKNVLPSIFSTILMGGMALILKLVNDNVIWDFVSIIICVIFYFSVLLQFPQSKKELVGIIGSLNFPYKEKLTGYQKH